MTDVYLHGVLAELIERRRVRLVREGEQRAEWCTLPSLWEQLETSVMQTGGTGSGGSSASRLPISVTVVDLIVAISVAAAEGAVEHVGTSRHNAPGNLRAVVSKLVVLSEDDDVRVWWTGRIRDWAAEARSALRLNPERPRWARGIACPDCGATHATGTDGVDETRVPALGIVWSGPAPDEGHHPDSEWAVRAVVCGGCGSAWWRGVGLDGLVEQMLRAAAG